MQKGSRLRVPAVLSRILHCEFLITNFSLRICCGFVVKSISHSSQMTCTIGWSVIQPLPSEFQVGCRAVLNAIKPLIRRPYSAPTAARLSRRMGILAFPCIEPKRANIYAKPAFMTRMIPATILSVPMPRNVCSTRIKSSRCKSLHPSRQRPQPQSFGSGKIASGLRSRWCLPLV